MTTTEVDNRAAIKTWLSENPGKSAMEAGTVLGLSELAVLEADEATNLTKKRADFGKTVMKSVTGWGEVLTIVSNSGSIFEFKGAIPNGSFARGYYNLFGKSGELSGHLRLDRVETVAFVSRPFHGMTTHFIGFFTALGDCVFKIFPARDENREMLAHQLEAFEALKNQPEESTDA